MRSYGAAGTATTDAPTADPAGVAVSSGCALLVPRGREEEDEEDEEEKEEEAVDRSRGLPTPPAVMSLGVGSAAGSLVLALFCSGCFAEPTVVLTCEPLLVAAGAGGDSAAALAVVAALAGFVAVELAALDPVADDDDVGSCPWFFAILTWWLNQLVSWVLVRFSETMRAFFCSRVGLCASGFACTHFFSAATWCG